MRYCCDDCGCDVGFAKLGHMDLLADSVLEIGMNFVEIPGVGWYYSRQPELDSVKDAIASLLATREEPDAAENDQTQTEIAKKLVDIIDSPTDVLCGACHAARGGSGAAEEMVCLSDMELGKADTYVGTEEELPLLFAMVRVQTLVPEEEEDAQGGR